MFLRNTIGLLASSCKNVTVTDFMEIYVYNTPMLNEDRSGMAKNYLLQMNPGKHSSWEIHPALLFSKPYAILPFLELHRTLKINIIIVVSMYFNIIF